MNLSDRQAALNALPPQSDPKKTETPDDGPGTKGPAQPAAAGQGAAQTGEPKPAPETQPPVKRVPPARPRRRHWMVLISFALVVLLPS